MQLCSKSCAGAIVPEVQWLVLLLYRVTNAEAVAVIKICS
jgi:hypothetical protein